MKIIFLSFGLFFTGLALAGIVLPFVPTTPFLLVAAACFARSSKKFHNLLLNNPIFGPMIKNWQQNRTIPRQAKITAIVLITFVSGLSMLFFVTTPSKRMFLMSILFIPAIILILIPSAEK